MNYTGTIKFGAGRGVYAASPSDRPEAMDFFDISLLRTLKRAVARAPWRKKHDLSILGFLAS